MVGETAFELMGWAVAQTAGEGETAAAAAAAAATAALLLPLPPLLPGGAATACGRSLRLRRRPRNLNKAP